MSILSRADIYKLQVIHDTGLDHLATGSIHVDLLETCLAMRKALEAWAIWIEAVNYVFATYSFRGEWIKSELVDKAMELTKAAGVDCQERNRNGDTD